MLVAGGRIDDHPDPDPGRIDLGTNGADLAGDVDALDPGEVEGHTLPPDDRSRVRSGPVRALA